jgi:hypothetical protein
MEDGMGQSMVQQEGERLRKLCEEGAKQEEEERAGQPEGKVITITPGWIAAAGCAIVFIGFIICLANNGGGTGAPPVKSAEITGGIMIGVPVLCGVIAVMAAVTRESQRLAEQHRAWLDSMPPEQRQAVIRAEQAAAWAATAVAAAAMWEHHKRVDAKNTQTVVHGFGNRTERYYDQQPEPPASAGWDPTASTNELLQRSHDIRQANRAFRDENFGPWR